MLLRSIRFPVSRNDCCSETQCPRVVGVAATAPLVVLGCGVAVVAVVVVVLGVVLAAVAAVVAVVAVAVVAYIGALADEAIQGHSF